MRYARFHILTLVAIGVLLLLFLAPEGEAARIVAVCAEETDRSACYEREIPPLLGSLSVPQVFEVVREVRKMDVSYQFCHVLAHKIGEAVVAEDPARWLQAIPLNPSDGLCSNGFVHGVIGGRFRAEVLDDETLERYVSDFRLACEAHDSWNPSDLDRAICYHGMGHLYVFITDADLRKALSLCERTAVSDSDFRRVCREGVFMQIYQPLEPDDFLLLERMPEKPTKETVRTFCARYEEDEYEGACLRESWPFFMEDLMRGTGFKTFCSGQPNAQEERACYESAFSILGRQTLADEDKSRAACLEAPENWRSLCFEQVARAILEEDRTAAGKAAAFCASAPDAYARQCGERLVETASFMFHPVSPEKRELCASFSGSLRDQCLLR